MSSEHPQFLRSLTRIAIVCVVMAFVGCSDKSVEPVRGSFDVIRAVPWDMLPVWSPKGDLIAYEHYNTGWGDADTSGVYLIRCDGSEKSLLAPWGIEPAWHPSGNSLAFAHQGGIWTYDISSHSISLLISLSSARLPSYSPDGRLLSFSRADTLCIYDLAADSVSVARDTADSAILAIFTSWNPVDGRLVFERRLSTVAIWTFDRASGCPQPQIERGAFPRWSPDGQAICYNGENPGTSIYNLATSSCVYVTELFHPCFSPQGDKIVGTRFVDNPDRPQDARYRLFICDIETHELTQLTH